MIATKRFAACDAPGCGEAVELKDINDYPAAWRKVHSTDHLTKAQKKTSGDYYLGSIHLDLCPEHVASFDAHLPQTLGFGGKRGREGTVYVSCSCGVDLGRAAAGWRTRAPEDVPDRYPEAAWWQHLPADLKTYYRTDPR